MTIISTIAGVWVWLLAVLKMVPFGWKGLIVLGLIILAAIGLIAPIFRFLGLAVSSLGSSGNANPHYQSYQPIQRLEGSNLRGPGPKLHLANPGIAAIPKPLGMRVHPRLLDFGNKTLCNFRVDKRLYDFRIRNGRLF